MHAVSIDGHTVRSMARPLERQTPSFGSWVDGPRKICRKQLLTLDNVHELGIGDGRAHHLLSSSRVLRGKGEEATKV